MSKPNQENTNKMKIQENMSLPNISSVLPQEYTWKKPNDMQENKFKITIQNMFKEFKQDMNKCHNEDWENTNSGVM